MPVFKADMHIHSVLSPCADLDMSPANIVKQAKAKNLDIVAITDHNSTHNCKTIGELAAKQNIFCLPGCEINTKEEIHVLTFFEDYDVLSAFQQYLNNHLPPIINRPGLFGFQVIVDEKGNILGYEDKYLGSALNVSIEEVEKKVHELNGIFVPAHVDRHINSIFSQLGFIPEDLQFEALQISKRVNEKNIRDKYKIANGINLVKFSDAHYPDDIGEAFTYFEIPEISFSEIKKALLKQENCKTFFQ